MSQYLPMIFSLLVSASVAAAFIIILVCGALDGLSRLIHCRDTRQLRSIDQPHAEG